MKCKDDVECEWDRAEVTQAINTSQHAERQYTKHRRQH